MVTVGIEPCAREDTKKMDFKFAAVLVFLGQVAWSRSEFGVNVPGGKVSVGLSGGVGAGGHVRAGADIGLSASAGVGSVRGASLAADGGVQISQGGVGIKGDLQMNDQMLKSGLIKNSGSTFLSKLIGKKDVSTDNLLGLYGNLLNIIMNLLRQRPSVSTNISLGSGLDGLGELVNGKVSAELIKKVLNGALTLEKTKMDMMKTAATDALTDVNKTIKEGSQFLSGIGNGLENKFDINIGDLLNIIAVLKKQLGVDINNKADVTVGGDSDKLVSGFKDALNKGTQTASSVINSGMELERKKMEIMAKAGKKALDVFNGGLGKTTGIISNVVAGTNNIASQLKKGPEIASQFDANIGKSKSIGKNIDGKSQDSINIGTFVPSDGKLYDNENAAGNLINGALELEKMKMDLIGKAATGGLNVLKSGSKKLSSIASDVIHGNGRLGSNIISPENAILKGPENLASNVITTARDAHIEMGEGLKHVADVVGQTNAGVSVNMPSGQDIIKIKDIFSAAKGGQLEGLMSSSESTGKKAGSMELEAAVSGDAITRPDGLIGLDLNGKLNGGSSGNMGGSFSGAIGSGGLTGTMGIGAAASRDAISGSANMGGLGVGGGFNGRGGGNMGGSFSVDVNGGKGAGAMGIGAAASGDANSVSANMGGLGVSGGFNGRGGGNMGGSFSTDVNGGKGAGTMGIGAAASGDANSGSANMGGLGVNGRLNGRGGGNMRGSLSAGLHRGKWAGAMGIGAAASGDAISGSADMGGLGFGGRLRGRGGGNMGGSSSAGVRGGKLAGSLGIGAATSGNADSGSANMDGSGISVRLSGRGGGKKGGSLSGGIGRGKWAGSMQVGGGNRLGGEIQNVLAIGNSMNGGAGTSGSVVSLPSGSGSVGAASSSVGGLTGQGRTTGGLAVTRSFPPRGMSLH